MKNSTTTKFLFLFLFLATALNASAQKDIKNSTAPKAELPKLEKVLILGDQYGVKAAPDRESFGPHISDIEANNRSQSDGKISKREYAIIEKAKRMPQDR